MPSIDKNIHPWINCPTHISMRILTVLKDLPSLVFLSRYTTAPILPLFSLCSLKTKHVVVFHSIQLKSSVFATVHPTLGICPSNPNNWWSQLFVIDIGKLSTKIVKYNSSTFLILSYSSLLLLSAYLVVCLRHLGLPNYTHNNILFDLPR